MVLRMEEMTPALLWPELWLELRTPDIIWQVAGLAACLLLSLALTRLLVRRFSTRHNQQKTQGVEAFAPVLRPFLALVFLSLLKPALGQWQHVSLLKVAQPVIVSLALTRLVFYCLRRVFSKPDRAGSLLQVFEKVFATLVWLGLAIYLTGLWYDLVAYLDGILIPVGSRKTSLLTIVQAGIAIATTLLIALWAGTVLEERLMRVHGIHSSARIVMARAGRATLILIAILVSLSLAGIDLTVLSVFGGALGVGIGLGLQKIVSSYVSGFVVLLERSLSVGDMVSVATYYGQVTQINTRYTVIRSLDGIETLVPNEMLVSGAVQNHSLSDRRLRLSTRLTVTYEANVESLLPKLVETVRTIPRICENPAPHALLMNFGADGLELEVGFWIEDPENGKGNLLSTVNRAIWRLLQEENVGIAYPQRDVRLSTNVLEGQSAAEDSAIKQ